MTRNTKSDAAGAMKDLSRPPFMAAIWTRPLPGPPGGNADGQSAGGGCAAEFELTDEAGGACGEADVRRARTGEFDGELVTIDVGEGGDAGQERARGIAAP